MISKAYFLDCGICHLDKSVLIGPSGAGIVVKVPVFSMLLESDSGWTLIDTGLNPTGVTDPDKAWGPRAKTVKPTMKPENDINYRIKELGLKNDDIKRIILTHMHWDHTGGNRFFPNAIFYVQRAEYRFAYYPDKIISGSYMRDHFDCGSKYELIEGDTEIIPGVYVFQSPGHTPGHQSVLIKMKSGKKLLITGDAVYTQQNVDLMLPPGNNWDPNYSIFSLNKIKTIQEQTGAILIPAHDPDFWDNVPRSPDAVI